MDIFFSIELTACADICYLLIRFIGRVMWLEFVAKDDPGVDKSWSMGVHMIETFGIAENGAKYQVGQPSQKGAHGGHTLLRSKKEL